MEPDHRTLTDPYLALREQALAWRAADPDPDTQFEVELLLAAGDHPGLEDRFGHRLRFGTGGFRGEMGAGPNRVNRVVVRQAARALLATINDFGIEAPTVVIGFDARRKSQLFADEIAATVLALGGRVARLAYPVATPVLAFAVRHLGGDAGMMITASHNVASDNGLKIFGPTGSLLVVPADARIEMAMASLALAPRDGVAPVRAPLAPVPVDDDIVGAYLDAALPDAWPDPEVAALRVVYTPLHGTGLDPMLRACVRLGVAPIVVSTQTETDPATWTVDRPNPEEPAALEHALRVAREHDADVVLAHDADADRLGVAVRTAQGFRRLSGDEVGVLLAEHVLARTSGDDRLVINTIVSSSMLAKIAAEHGVVHRLTLPGMRWVLDAARSMPSHRLVYAYEEALGYVVTDAVRDKDGIAAAVCMLQALGALRRRGATVEDALAELDARHGSHLTAQVAVRFPGIGGRQRLGARLDALRAEPPASVGGATVCRFADHAAGGDGLPAANLMVIECDIARGARVLMRPSDTEPLLKIYVEVVTEAGDPSGPMALEQLARDARSLVLGAGI